MVVVFGHHLQLLLHRRHLAIDGSTQIQELNTHGLLMPILHNGLILAHQVISERKVLRVFKAFKVFKALIQATLHQ